MIVEEIITGWKNFVFKDKQTEKIAKERIAVCLDKKKCTKLNERFFCTICNCYMPAKVRSPRSKCPLRKW